MSRAEDRARRELDERIGRELAEAMIPVAGPPEGFRFQTYAAAPSNPATSGDVTLESLAELLETLPPPGDPVVRVECGSLEAVRRACAEHYPPRHDEPMTLQEGEIPLLGWVPIVQVSDLAPHQLKAVHRSGREVIL